MKLNPISWLLRDEGNLIVLFGNGRLVKRLNGKFQLLGGSGADRAEAKESCSLFVHEAVFVSLPPRIYVAAPVDHQCCQRRNESGGEQAV